MTTTILLVDDHPIVRQGLHLLLDGQGDMRVVGEAGDGQAAIDRVRELDPDVVVMDITLPTLGGVDATRQILAESPETKVIALSIHGDKRFIEEMLQAGAAGYILKDSAPEELVDGVRAVMRGEAVLSAAVAGVVVSEYRQALLSEQIGEGDQDRTAPDSIIATKFYRPPVRPDLERRPRLMERLEHNCHRPLTLIAAPAGYGKTMLASLWLDACGCPSAWVSLDESDNDLRLFTSYLLAALHTAFPALELKTQSLLEAPVLPPVPALARYLLNDVEQIPEPFILALDDVHLIRDEAVLDLLSELLRHPSPSMSLLLIGRRDPPLPIASLRAHRQVTEVRAGDLRFTPEEAARLLGTLLNREIDGATAAEWTRRTEGWVTGLLLAALSLRHRAEADEVGLGIPEYSPYLQDYLVAEVLANLPPARRDWLLLASLLDRFCAPLCEAVGQSDAAASLAGLTGIEFIRWLQADNLFLVPLDDRSEWFRFHHLFAQLVQRWLREHLEPDRIAAAHLRAGDWFAKEGLIEEALQHALAGGDVQSAVHIVEQHRYHLMNTEQWHRLERWLKQLPEDAVAQNPILMSTLAYVATHRGQDLEMVSSMKRAEQLLAKLPPEAPEVQTVQGEVTVIQGVLDIIAGQVAHAVTCAQRSLDLLPPQALHIRAIATAILAVGLQMQGNLRQGVAELREALADRAWPAGMHAKMLFFLSIAYLQEGNLTGVLGSARECLQIAEPLRLVESLSFARYFLGVAHYLRDEFAQAEPYLLALLEDRAVSAPNYLANGVFALALIYLAQDRLVEAEQVIDLVSAHYEETRDSFALAYTEAFRVELALRKGDLAEAHHLSQGVEFNVRPPIWFFYVPQLTPNQLLLAEGTVSSLDEARTRLDVLDEQMGKIHRNNVRIDVLVLLALVHDARGDEAAAMEKLSAALSLGKRGGFIRTFVDLGAPMAGLLSRLRDSGMAGHRDTLPYVEQILAAFGPETDDQQPVANSANAGPSSSLLLNTAEGLIEPLSERELEVLELLAQRLTYKEIGALLFITPGTVSGHAVRIYSKLQVNNRRQAVAKALALGILSQ